MRDQTSSRSDALLQVQNLTVALPAGGDRPYAVQDVSFTLNKNEI